MYAQSDIIKFAFLLTDESITSLGKEVPDIINYTSTGLLNFSENIDDQLRNYIGLSSEEMNHIRECINNIR